VAATLISLETKHSNPLMHGSGGEFVYRFRGFRPADPLQKRGARLGDFIFVAGKTRAIWLRISQLWMMFVLDTSAAKSIAQRPLAKAAPAGNRCEPHVNEPVDAARDQLVDELREHAALVADANHSCRRTLQDHRHTLSRPASSRPETPSITIKPSTSPSGRTPAAYSNRDSCIRRSWARFA